MEEQPSLQIECDIAIVGGGISGLWLLNDLHRLGYNAVLCEKTAIGSGQTICSQGIIHGGVKYSLKGAVSKSTMAIAKMPGIWQDCLQGFGSINLSKVRVLSDVHYLCIQGRSFANLKSVISSSLLSSGNKVLSKADYPKLLQNKAFNASVCAINETVLDVYSLLQELQTSVADRILLADKVCQFKINKQGIKTLTIQTGKMAAEVIAKQYIFTAGAGNEELVRPVCDNVSLPIMQLRPLHMVWLKFNKSSDEQAIFMHYVHKGTVPRITITSHRDRNSNLVWYLGGGLAEIGVNNSPSQQIDLAKKELQEVFPWLDLSECSWGTKHVDRAEIANNGKRPEYYSIKKVANDTIVSWPTKLALAPALSSGIVNMLNIKPQVANGLHHVKWPRVNLAEPIWW